MVDDWWPALYAAVLLSCGVIVLATSGARRQRDAYLDRIASNIGVPLPEELRARLRRGQVTRQRIFAGALLVGAAVAAALWIFSATTGHVVSQVAAFVLMSVVVATGVLVGELVVPRALSEPRGLRVAHGRAVGIDDYVPPWLLATIRIACVAIAVIAVVALLVPLRGRTPTAWGPAAAAVAGIASVGALVVVEALARAVIARRQDATGRDELIWGDAIRAQALIRAYTLPLMLAMWTAFDVIPPLVQSLLPAPFLREVSGLSFLYPPTMLVPVVAWVIVWTRSAPEKQFLRRLWPEPASAPSPTVVEG